MVCNCYLGVDDLDVRPVGVIMIKNFKFVEAVGAPVGVKKEFSPSPGIPGFFDDNPRSYSRIR